MAIKKPCILICILSLLGTKALAYDIAVKNTDGITIYYNYINDETELEVSYETTSYNSYSGVVVVPEEVIYMSKTRKVTRIGHNAFRNCSTLTSITIPSSVKRIGDNAFRSCSGLTSIAPPNSVTSIGTSAFLDTPWFDKQPDGLVYAGKVAYKYKGEMPANTEIILDKGTLGIADGAFYGFDRLTSVIVPNSVTSIGRRAFGSCSCLSSVMIGDNVTSIEAYAFSECSALTSVTIPNSVKSIGCRAFNCCGLTSIIIPNSVEYIEWGAFEECVDLSSATISNNVEVLYHGTFACSGLTSVIIPNSVYGIADNVFYGCSDLMSVTIPSSVTIIGNFAFGECPNLTSVTIDKSTPISITGDTFSNRGIATLYVPAGSVNTYSSSDYWKEFKEIKEIPENVAVTGITLNESSINIKRIGKTKQLVANVLPTDATNKAVNWMSATPAVCSVSAEGLVTAVGAGNGIVIATTVDGGKMAMCNVNVTPTDHASFTMNANGIATFSDEDDLDFTSVSGLKAYIGSGYNPATGDMTMTRVYEVPAGEGLLLKGAAGSYEIPYNETSVIYANMLVGVPTATTIGATDGDYTNFILSNGVNGITFYKTNAGEIGANKAYLKLPTSALPAATSRQVKLIFEDEMEEVTSISEKWKVESEKSAFFDLQGRRVVKPTRGLYVKNGKKVFVK